MAPSEKELREALRYMGVPRGGFEAFAPLAERGFAELEPVACRRSCWRRVDLSLRGSELSLDGGSAFCISGDLSRLFAHCRGCAVMAVTLGPEVDRRIALLQRSDMASALALDACASVLADRLCDELEREIESGLAGGEYLTLRFSPGYGDVPMDFTADLLRLLDAGRRLGLTLTRSMMMTPVKSVTALIGISDREEPRRRSCSNCGMKNCPYRKKGGFCDDR
jgi:hypothetical protein